MRTDMRSTSKFISLILRHKPEVIGITLDEHGWADVQALIDGVNATGRHHLTPETLEEWRGHLLKYCELDTLAMVKVLGKLREAVE